MSDLKLKANPISQQTQGSSSPSVQAGKGSSDANLLGAEFKDAIQKAGTEEAKGNPVRAQGQGLNAIPDSTEGKVGKSGDAQAELTADSAAGKIQAGSSPTLAGPPALGLAMGSDSTINGLEGDEKVSSGDAKLIRAKSPGSAEASIDPAMMAALQMMQARFSATSSSGTQPESRDAFKAGTGLNLEIIQKQLLDARVAAAKVDSKAGIQGSKTDPQLQGLAEDMPPGDSAGAIDLSTLPGMKTAEGILAQLQTLSQAVNQESPLEPMSDVGSEDGIPAELLNQLGGSIESASGSISGSHRTGRSQEAQMALGRGSALSGGDFIETLMQARAPQASGKAAFTEGALGKSGSPNLLEERIGISQAGLRPKSKIAGILVENSEQDEASQFLGAGPSAAAGAGMTPQGQGAPDSGAGVSTITGHVTLGAMAQPRLSSESMAEVSNQIRGFSRDGKGTGEIHIRLRPENLGELHLKIVTQGNQVGIQIQASDEHARKVIEESLGHLKESLSGQNLSLSQFDVTIGQPVSHTSSDPNLNQNFDGRPSGGFEMNQGRDFQQGGRGGSSRFDSDSGSSAGLSGRAGSLGFASRNAQAFRSTSDGSNFRLDVMA